MKKFGFAFVLACALSFGASAGVVDSLLMWLPNRVLDLTDIVSVGVGCGGLKAEARVTRAIDLSIGEGFNLMARKDHNRHYGITLEQGRHFNFIYLGYEDYRIDEVVSCRLWNFPLAGGSGKGTFKPTAYQYEWVCSPCEDEYDLKNGSRDWWEIAVEGSCGLAARVAVHPVQLADFICGIFCVDLLDDDLKLE